MNLCDRNDIQSLLAHHGFRFAKSLGQNFLIEGWVAEDIAAAVSFLGLSSLPSAAVAMNIKIPFVLNA